VPPGVGVLARSSTGRGTEVRAKMASTNCACAWRGSSRPVMDGPQRNGCSGSGAGMVRSHKYSLICATGSRAAPPRVRGEVMLWSERSGHGLAKLSRRPGVGEGRRLGAEPVPAWCREGSVQMLGASATVRLTATLGLAVLLAAGSVADDEKPKKKPNPVAKGTAAVNATILAQLAAQFTAWDLNNDLF